VVRFSFPEANSSPRSALRSAVPTVYEGRDFVMAGGLLSYGGSLADSYLPLLLLASGGSGNRIDP
jgi:hypothetical protein